jgi:hypothetical protein
MAEEIIEEATVPVDGGKPSTFNNDLYQASIKSGFIPKDATYDEFVANLSDKAFSNDAYNFSIKVGLIPKDATVDEFTSNLEVKKKDKPATESPVDGGSSGLPKFKYNGTEYGYNAATLQVFEPDGTELKQVEHLGKTYDVKDYLTNVIGVKPKQIDNTEYDFKTGFADRQQGAINNAMSPDVQSERLIKRNKKFPDFNSNPQIADALSSYNNLKAAAQNTSDKQDEYDLFLNTGAIADENGQDIRPLGAMPTDYLGTTAIVEGSPAAQVKKDLEANLKKAKEDENKAYDDLGNKENTFRDKKLPELPVRKELGGDKYEYEMPSQVKVIDFMQGMSNLENHANGMGMSLKQYSDSVENISSDAFLTPDQQNLFKELNSGDERAARSAIARYDENIDKQINAINKQLALGATPAQKAYLINERTRLTDEKSDFFSPRKAIEAVGTLNPQLKPVFDAFVGIGDQDKASLVYAKVFKDSQDLSDELIGQPLFIEQDGKQVLNPKVTDYLVGGQNSPFRQKNADKRELLQKNINTLNLLAKATLLNRRPLEKKGSFIESFGKTIAKGIGFDTGFTQTMVETDKPSVIANFLADATISTRDLPTNQAKQLEQIGKQSNWEFAGSTLGYLIPAGVQLAVGGAELRGLELIANALKRTSTAAALASDVINITRGSSMLSKAVKMGADAQLGGWTFNDPEMGFANIGAESLAGELFEKAIKKLPGGALVTKVAKKVFADNYLTAMNKIGKANAYGLGETTGEFAGSLVQLYQDSDTWNDFYDKFQQQFGEAGENLKFFISCYSLGMVTGNHAAPATKAIDSAADKAYQKLTPDEKKIADEVIENDVDATNVATVDVLRNNVQVVPDADLKTRIEQVKKAKADLDALPDLKANTQNAGAPYVVPSKQGEVKNAKEGAYEIKVGDITLSGNTPEQLANDKDLINSLDLIYSGEQQRREAEGITVETPPIEAGKTDTEAADVGGVGVEGAVVPEDVSDVSAKQEGTNKRGSTYKTETTEKDGIKVTKYIETNKDGRNITVGGRVMTPKEFIKDYNVTDQNDLDNLDGATEIVVQEVRTNKEGKQGITVRVSFGTEKMAMDVKGAELPTQTQPSDTANLPQDVQDKIAKLRADEQADLRAAIPNIDEYKVDGEIDKKKIENSPDGAAYKKIYDQYNAPITALFEQGKKEGVTEPIQAPVIKAQVVGTTAGFNTIIDGGLGKQKDPRTAFTSSERSPVFETQPNNNESSFLDISLPSYDSFGRSGGIQIRFELPNGVDANTVFEAVKKEAAKVGSLDAKDPNFKQTVQGLVDKGIAEIQGLATGGAKQTAQVKETVSEKQGGDITLRINEKNKQIRNDKDYYPYDIIDSNGGNLGSIELMYRADLDAYQVANSSVKEKGKGVGKKAYLDLIKFLDKPIYSDSSLTTDAENLWKSLVKSGDAYYDKSKGKYVSEKQVPEPLKDVESTTKALEGTNTEDIGAEISVSPIQDYKAGANQENIDVPNELDGYDVINLIQNTTGNKGAGAQLILATAAKSKKGLAVYLADTDTKVRDIFKKLGARTVGGDFLVIDKAIAEAYHKAKADKSNPDLVKAVEELLAPKAAPVAGSSNSTETETKDGTKVEEIKPSKVVGFNEGVEAVKKNAEEYKKILNEQRKQQNPSAKPARANEPVPKLFTAVSKMIADAYNSIIHQPSKEEVKAAYDALVEETAAQYNFIVSKGLKVERHTGKGEPYSSSKEMLKDIKENNTLKFLPNDVAFGQGTTAVSDNIGLQPSGIKLKDGYELTNSEVFRIVHDYFGHGILGNEFGAIGEENATLQHLDLYSDVAAPAVIFQTRGQNSWVNYSGVNAKANELRKKARELDRQGKPNEAKKLLEEADKIFKFAEPKIAIFPTKFNFKRYETARRIAEKAQVDSRPDKRANGLSKLLERLSEKSGRATRGVNKRSIRGVKRLGGFSINVKAEYTLDSKINQAIAKAFPDFKGVQKIYEVTDGKVFREMMLAALKTNKFASSVTVHSAEEFDGMRMFVTEDGSTGITLTKEGFIGGGFSDPSAKRPNNLAPLLILGIKEGATTAEAFDTILPDYYAQFGFKAVSRVDFNDELKPDGWDYNTYKKYNNGKPDVVLFIFDGGDRNTIEDRVGLFDDYENYEKSNTKQFDKDSYDKAVDFMKQAAVKRLEFDLGIEATVEAAPTPAERKAEVASVVDKWAEKAKAALGSTSDPNIKASGLTADVVVDLIADLVKDLANIGIDAAEAIKTAKAKLKELGVSDALISEAEAKYTGKEQAIPTEIIDDLLGSDANKRRNAKRNLPTETIKETAAVILKDNDIEAIFQEDTDESLAVLMKLKEKLGIKKIC